MEIRAISAQAPGADTRPPGGFQAWAGDRLAGILTLTPPLGRTAAASAFVPPEYRRRGIFSALLRAAEAACRGEGVEQLHVVCDGASADGQAVAAHWGLMPDRRTYVLLLRSPRSVPPRDDALRPAGPEDWPQVSALTAAAFPDEDVLSTVKAALSDPERQCWALWEGAVPVAAEQIGRFFAAVEAACVGPAAEGLSLYAVAVDPARQGQGLGRRLMEALLAVLPPEKPVVAEVDGGNRPARALYAACGFTPLRRWDYFLPGRQSATAGCGR